MTEANVSLELRLVTLSSVYTLQSVYTLLRFYKKILKKEFPMKLHIDFQFNIWHVVPGNFKIIQQSSLLELLEVEWLLTFQVNIRKI